MFRLMVPFVWLGPRMTLEAANEVRDFLTYNESLIYDAS